LTTALNGLETNKEYIFSVKANNIFGSSPLSTPVVSVKTIAAPSKMSPPSLTQSG